MQAWGSESVAASRLLALHQSVMVGRPLQFDAEEFEAKFETYILHEDSHLICISKPAGLLSQPDVSGVPAAGDLATRWLRRTERAGSAWPVHRLDQRVTGCLLLARSQRAAAQCSAAFATAGVTKHYLGVVACGSDRAARIEVGECGRLIVPGREKDEADPRLVEWRALAVADGSVLLDINPLGGSKHQIRKTLAWVGLALAGDVLYGSKPIIGGALALHAATLQLDHPVLHGRDTQLRFLSPLPVEWELGLPGALVAAAKEVLRPHGSKHCDGDSVLWDPSPEPNPLGLPY